MANLDARSWRDAHTPALREDECTPPAPSKPASVLSPADWRKLEWTIAKGVASGLFLIWILSAVIALLAVLATRGMQ